MFLHVFSHIFLYFVYTRNFYSLNVVNLEYKYIPILFIDIQVKSNLSCNEDSIVKHGQLR